jgi:F0F1-type ATP synthase membrane subunit c/vacuolar-type H+-ATPase subunit K
MGLVPGKGAPTAGTVTVGVIGMLIGLALCLTVYGAVIGVPLLIYAAIRGSAKQRGLRCTACRHFIPAA